MIISYNLNENKTRSFHYIQENLRFKNQGIIAFINSFLFQWIICICQRIMCVYFNYLCCIVLLYSSSSKSGTQCTTTTNRILSKDTNIYRPEKCINVKWNMIKKHRLNWMTYVQAHSHRCIMYNIERWIWDHIVVHFIVTLYIIYRA